jgi:hypothetical protein
MCLSPWNLADAIEVKLHKEVGEFPVWAAGVMEGVLKNFPWVWELFALNL